MAAWRANGDPGGTDSQARRAAAGRPIAFSTAPRRYCASPGSGRSAAAPVRACWAFPIAPAAAAVFPSRSAASYCLWVRAFRTHHPAPRTRAAAPAIAGPSQNRRISISARVRRARGRGPGPIHRIMGEGIGLVNTRGFQIPVKPQVRHCSLSDRRCLCVATIIDGKSAIVEQLR